MKAAWYSPETSEGLGGDVLILDLLVSVKLTAEKAFWFPSLCKFGGQVQIRDLWFTPLIEGFYPVLPCTSSITKVLGKFPQL